uniref:Retrotransposon Copia-like N-terminal domain-containing protein n=1 Tax=Cajanus cajan TaxID=3821 RepID=A0A151SJZ2_CAJCA|nr:hypothetical protein KK1_001274 [Cajanus cajan]
MVHHQYLPEGASLIRLLAFSGEDYLYWNDRMKMFIKSTEYHFWKIITEGDVVVSKVESEYTQEDYNILQLNTKARCILTFSLSRTKYKKICSCKICKVIREVIRITHKGTENVRLKRATTLQRHYKLFSVKKNEIIDEMFG